MKKFKFLPILLITGYFLLITASIASAVSPAIISVYPANGATNIYPRPLITAYFDKDVNPASINNNTFKLKNASFGNGIDGDVSYSLSERKASFKPSGNLAYDNKYTVTITTGAYDLEGNHLISDYVWEFTTIKNTDMPISTAGCDYPIWEWDKLGLTLNEEGKCVKKPTAEDGIIPTPGDEVTPNQNPPNIMNSGPQTPPDVQQQPSAPSASAPSKSISVPGFLGAIVPCGECTAWDTAGVCTKIKECTICHLFQGVSNIVDFLLKNIAFPLGVVAILYGGFMMMTSGGSEEKVKKGKTALQYAVIGIILAFAGWLIVGTILSSLVLDKAVWPFSKEWNTIPTCK